MMEDQVKSAEKAYKSTLSLEQKELLEAVESGDLDVVNRLFSEMSKTKREDKWLDYVLLTTAVERKHESVVKFLLTSGCRTKTEEKTKFLCTPLYYAIEKDEYSVMRDLIKEGASAHDTDLNEKSPLEYAAEHDKLKVIKVILRHRKYIQSNENLSPSDRGDLALFHAACYEGNEQAVREFLRAHFPLNSQSTFGREDWKGFTPLHFSLLGSRSSITDLLVRYKADLSAQDDRGETPIHLAFRACTPDGVSPNSRYSNLFKKWLKDLADKKFSNPQDQNGLSHFHMFCSVEFERLWITNWNSKCLKAIQLFLDNKVDINSSVSLDDKDYPGCSALHFAVRNVKKIDITKMLLANRADHTKTDKEGLTPLHMVCDRLLQSNRSHTNTHDFELERIKIVKLLLSHGADVDVNSLQRGTPIHFAFCRFSPGAKQDESLTRLLLSKSKMSINFTDSHGLSYLHIASSTDLAAVKILVENGAPINSSVDDEATFKPGYSTLHFAVSSGKVEIVEYLLNHGADPNICVNKSDSKMTPLHIACRYTAAQCESIEQFPYSDFVEAVQARQTAKIRIIELLLKHGASVNAKDSSGNTPLSIACGLPSSSAYANGGWGLILIRLFEEQRKIIEILLQNGADVHSRNNDDESVLHVIASQRESIHQMTTLAEMMLEKGAQVNVRNKRGLTAMHVAVTQRYDLSLVQVLQEYGADVNARDGKGLTPLHLAVQIPPQNFEQKSTGLSLVQFFLDNGADVNAKSSELRTPLHIVVENFARSEESHEKLLLHLLDHPKIDVIAQDNLGNTPLHIAGNDFKLTRNSSIMTGNAAYLLLITYKRFCIEKLLYAGANINISNSDKVLPVHQMLQWLLKNSSSSDQNFLSFLSLIVTHIKKLMRMNVYVSEEIKKVLDELSSIRLESSLAIDLAIDEELDKMKFKFVDQYTSLHDILLKDANDMSKHVKNDNFTKMINSSTLSTDFPIFHNSLIQKFKMGSARRSILGPAKEALENVLRVSWPNSCCEHVLRYLSNNDLRSLVLSISAKNSRKRTCQNLLSRDESRSKVQKSH